MLDNLPLRFPHRNFVMDPGVPDRQLWAIGMIVVVWSMTERMVEQQIDNLVGDDAQLKAERGEVRGFRNSVRFFKRLVELKITEPQRYQLSSAYNTCIRSGIRLSTAIGAVVCKQARGVLAISKQPTLECFSTMMNPQSNRSSQTPAL
jgi:hypothetical protein